MERPKFINGGTEIKPLEKLVDRPAHVEKIQKITQPEMIIKETKDFVDASEALEYIRKTPSKRNDKLSQYIPPTDYVIGDNTNSEGCRVYTFMKEIEGTQLDEIEPTSFDSDVTKQLDDFLASSLEIFDAEGISAGINLKNFILDADKKLWFIDSEPYPINIHAAFEIAHAREQKLTRLFGHKAPDIFPKTWSWIQKNKVSNYTKMKKETKKLRHSTKDTEKSTPPVPIPA